MNLQLIEKLIAWSQKQFKELPWRKKRSLYTTMVSEIMLQQTTVTAVEKRFESFLKRFPSLKTLALSSEEEVLNEWIGLGYYRRARNLHKAAQYFQSHFQTIPDQKEELLNAPGIGAYTANAIIAMGLDRPALAIDGNLIRVLARFYQFQGKRSQLESKIEKKFLQSGMDRYPISYRAFNEALMDLGRTICQNDDPHCSLCPLSSKCKANTNHQFDYLIKPEKKQYDLSLKRVLVIKSNKILLYKRPEKKWLQGQWEIPTFTQSCSHEKFDQYDWDQTRTQKQIINEVSSAITCYKIKNLIFKDTKLNTSEQKKLKHYEQKWFSWDDLETINLAHQSRKILLSKKSR